MSNAVSDLPAYDALRASLGQVFTLASADAAALPLVQTRLLDAWTGLAMNGEHECYSASFELPPAVALPQDTYRFIAPDGRAWLLFVSPGRPLESGARTLCAVIHRKRSACAADAV
ncbi:hypothetical protein GXB81_06580 [Paraburkholderia sp. Ac-20336]|uniref:DUF6916 family protein n=1 Tax=Burkholderiaceae TaxID=119060 RepID=UPI00141F7BA0|nr:hypothetical protein [Paraburkholderia sp. Ac-20336]MBN3849977.1 hypothetical protein [Paraburkholderia sp. Ac-20342]NIF52049.1 hypothetical protein [Burkholderia sp. Ax-1724]NIF79661.1 hypothetical protein [Paraburkholderia sp. Cy-641]